MDVKMNWSVFVPYAYRILHQVSFMILQQVLIILSHKKGKKVTLCFVKWLGQLDRKLQSISTQLLGLTNFNFCTFLLFFGHVLELVH